jgi:hypothetical protein
MKSHNLRRCEKEWCHDKVYEQCKQVLI